MSSNNPKITEAAARLQKQKHQDRLQSKTDRSAASRLEQISEEMIYWKKRLATKSPDANKIIDKLISLRAEQATLLIQDLHESSVVLAKQKTAAIIAAYYADCAKLMSVTKSHHHG